ncbi:D-alanyl-D-alanine carboxypeptidase/D-alanyl-D-alanine-endopeptidase [Arthrobacter sp. H5]|uniref:D-alanyl-D-alanine carboxypeptidase/D-alanyl-D-alanine endopeptidase n=1 Tax=Arthrobacter sp. H5 TaxID=1267973 RepID=UPI0004849557|nr:D-alanyl-D-alanine carboxypeptidase/D-alanyl-D-alanine-endopeptidase [Arthrobacter sp. H5]
MKRSARLVTTMLLVLALGALAVPFGLHFGPRVADVLAVKEPTPEPVIPSMQRPPEDLSVPTMVSRLDSAAPIPDPTVLESLLAEELVISGSGSFTGTVIDAETGETLYNRDGEKLQLPASNMKLLTATAVLTKLDPDKRLITSVHQGSEPGSLLLRAGGDVLLGSGRSDADGVIGHAGLATLAAQTAKELEAEGPVRIFLDDSLFAGPVLNAGWNAGDIENGEIAPIYPLAINSSWIEEGTQAGPRSQDAAMDAAAVFRKALAEAGIDVEEDIQRAPTPPDAPLLASVESATVSELVSHMLLTSDNYLAEALARVAAKASGRPASFGGGLETIVEALGALELPTEGMFLGDAAGLSPRTLVSPAQLAGLVQALLATEDRSLQRVLDGLPVAGLSGTLADRYNDGDAAAGAGLVRAKTGTLNAVTALTGHVVTAEGRLLAFSFIAGDLDGNTGQARAAADNAAAVLAACGCR